ncbi:hypothetical protein [Magnetospirillum moscoviense]|uniref:Lipoprotein n=1 Tax=Magnetospirillum moscoviense TaxID=1437059 RepID=A0A178MFZ4_9PROT|nr:hypothetical protein [Magnetospirillum moscoviense]OAN47047.1 hypothetical protein A6A05_15935 [Magnetospirillum moscoviense]
MRKTLTIIAATMTLAGALSACAYRGGDIGDPVVRKFYWYSFLSGDDIDEHCTAGMPDRFRVVYNGVYSEQVRIYQLDSLQKVLSVKVVGSGNAGKLSSDDLLSPWRADESKIALDQETYDRLVMSFKGDGMFAPPPVGLRLPSQSFYWTAASCLSGRYNFTAWSYPSDSFDRLVFGNNLFALDSMGIPVKAAGPVPFDPQRADSARRGEVTDFTLEVGPRGLRR